MKRQYTPEHHKNVQQKLATIHDKHHRDDAMNTTELEILHLLLERFEHEYGDTHICDMVRNVKLYVSQRQTEAGDD